MTWRQIHEMLYWAERDLRLEYLRGEVTGLPDNLDGIVDSPAVVGLLSPPFHALDANPSDAEILDLIGTLVRALDDARLEIKTLREPV